MIFVFLGLGPPLLLAVLLAAALAWPSAVTAGLLRSSSNSLRKFVNSSTSSVQSIFKTSSGSIEICFLTTLDGASVVTVLLDSSSPLK